MLIRSQNKKNGTTEEELLAGCKRADERIQARVYELWAPYMKGVCLRYVGYYDLAEDIMHEGFIKVFLGAKKVEWLGANSFKGWVTRVMVNLCIDHLKKEKRINKVNIDTADIGDEDTEKEPTEVFSLQMVEEKGLSKEQLLQMVDSLPETTRLVFNLYAIEQMSHREIATTLGIAEEASRTRLKRARIKLKELLENS